jgi:hypothetical protein
MSSLVQIDALRVARSDGKCSELRIQRIKASLAVAGGQPRARTELARVHVFDHTSPGCAGFTEANAYDLYYMPYTHGLPGSIAISLVLGLIVAMFTSGDRAVTIFLVAAASFSHWLLDLIVHVPDLPLYDNTAKVGFGLWRHVTLGFPLELIVLGLGAWLYARMTRFTSANGQYLYWGFVAVLAALQVYANFGPPPSSPETMAMTALLFYVMLRWPYWRHGLNALR